VVPDVLLPALARIGVVALPVRLREQVRDWDGLPPEQQQAARAELEAMAGAVTAGRASA
jgi:hypothetical protein